MKRQFVLLVLAAGFIPFIAAGDPTINLVVDTGKPGARINPAMWGVFFEDINFGADGGLYAELVKNRSFEFPEPMMGWSEIRRGDAVGSLEIQDQSPCSAVQPHYLRVTVQKADEGFGVANEGFRGIGVREGAGYNFSVRVRAVRGEPALRVELVGGDARPLASEKIDGFTSKWGKYAARLRAAATDFNAHLELRVEGRGALDLDMVSLFPAETWKQRPDGLRADLAQKLADLKPGFIRFPGGCIVEGRDLTNRYRWKNTIGEPAERRLIMNRWNVEFKDHAAPDYYQSFGLGFFELFQLCEDLGAEPLPVLNCGMACQFNSGQVASLTELDEYIQDALDLVEFANGPNSSWWGAKRTALGHPAPFQMKLLAIGNEQWGPQYVERYAQFSQALRVKHPEIKLIAATGPDPSGDRFDFLWSRMRELKADFLDEHFYRPPEWFLANVHRYDHYDRSGPKVFAGEYAAQVPSRANNLQSALAEAAMMTGFERNADVVRMASYAPLLAHVDAWQWKPDLIWFDNLRVAATPDYYVQQLFSRNRGEVVLPVIQNDRAPSIDGQPRLYVSASRDHKADEVILKAVNVTTEPIYASVRLRGVYHGRAKAAETVLTGDGLNDGNSLENPDRIVPNTRTITVNVPEFTQTFPALSVTVLRVGTKR